MREHDSLPDDEWKPTTNHERMVDAVFGLLPQAAELTGATDEDYSAAILLLWDALSVSWAHLAVAVGVSDEYIAATMSRMEQRVADCKAMRPAQKGQEADG